MSRRTIGIGSTRKTTVTPAKAPQVASVGALLRGLRDGPQSSLETNNHKDDSLVLELTGSECRLELTNPWRNGYPRLLEHLSRFSGSFFVRVKEKDSS